MADIIFSRVSKKYFIRQKMESNAAHPLHRLRSLWQGPQEVWAVRNMSFEVQRGEALGIIGHNGAGKTTTLKLLSSITVPTSGQITISGRLSALIEVGSGFHPELTGRENVYLNGSILGMRRREITGKLNSIVDFAGVGQFIDTPVKRYSWGMYVRLGFSIAAHLDPDILLLDEVLAVGDAAFQAKCLERIKLLKQAGKTIVFISHDLGALERLCDRALLIQRGEIVAAGRPGDVIAEYLRSGSNFTPSAPPGAQASNLSKEVECSSVSFYDSDGREKSVFRTGDSMTARIEYKVRRPVTDAVFGIFVYWSNGALCCQFTTGLSATGIDLKSGTGAIEFACRELGLQPGLYYVDVFVERYPQVIEWQYRCTTLRVDPGKAVFGDFYMPHEWRFISDNKARGKPYVENAIGNTYECESSKIYDAESLRYLKPDGDIPKT
jgi:ABC-type polysaccharide/polyol phosphate transport system ATPase subunit